VLNNLYFAHFLKFYQTVWQIALLLRYRPKIFFENGRCAVNYVLGTEKNFWKFIFAVPVLLALPIPLPLIAKPSAMSFILYFRFKIRRDICVTSQIFFCEKSDVLENSHQNQCWTSHFSPLAWYRYVFETVCVTVYVTGKRYSETPTPGTFLFLVLQLEKQNGRLSTLWNRAIIQSWLSMLESHDIHPMKWWHVWWRKIFPLFPRSSRVRKAKYAGIFVASLEKTKTIKKSQVVFYFGLRNRGLQVRILSGVFLSLW